MIKNFVAQKEAITVDKNQKEQKDLFFERIFATNKRLTKNLTHDSFVQSKI